MSENVIINQMRTSLTIAMSTTAKSIVRRKGNCYRAAAECRRNGKYEMCAFWLSVAKKLQAKYGC